MQVAVCENARLATCRSVVRFPWPIFQLIYLFSERPRRQYQVFEKLPQTPTLHVAHPDESVWCWDCPRNPGLRLRTGTSAFGRLGGQGLGAAVFPPSHGAWVYGLYGWSQGRKCGGPVPRSEELYIDLCTRGDPGGPWSSESLVWHRITFCLPRFLTILF